MTGLRVERETRVEEGSRSDVGMGTIVEIQVERLLRQNFQKRKNS
jgi:hypothetical protein